MSYFREVLFKGVHERIGIGFCVRGRVVNANHSVMKIKAQMAASNVLVVHKHTNGYPSF